MPTFSGQSKLEQYCTITSRIGSLISQFKYAYAIIRDLK